MQLTGLHLLLTLRCTHECDHCFVWGGPRQNATMAPALIRLILDQARELDSCKWIYFEGGEPFLMFQLLLESVTKAKRLGCKVGIVSNGYWAIDRESAQMTLSPFRDLVNDLSISCDPFHGDSGARVEDIADAARTLQVPFTAISISSACSREKWLPPRLAAREEYPVRYRGRAACKLAPEAPSEHWSTYSDCPYEDLSAPDRVHIDPDGFLHICQGLTIGDLREVPIKSIAERYNPLDHPIIGPLIRGGPAELVRVYGLGLEQRYADACHLCYEARRALMGRFSEHLRPPELYGKSAGCS